MTTEELERTMRTLEPIYDLVRVVDPNRMQGTTLGNDGELDMPHRCFDLLDKGRRCQNCISARTVSCKHSVSKFEFVGENAYYISTRYVEIDGQPRAIELVKQINEETLVAPANESAAQEVRSIMEHDADHRYKDKRTGALNRAYLDDGIGNLVAGKLAMLRADGVRVSTASGKDDTLFAIANAITDAIRNEDTLVHYEGTSFLVIFEGISRPRFQAVLEHMRRDVQNVLRLVAPHEQIEVRIGAVAREGTVSELVELAKGALERAANSDVGIVLDVQEASIQATEPSTMGTVPALGLRLHQSDILTNMPIPQVFREELSSLIDERDGWIEPLQVVHLDIENFKSFNRAYGLPEGDLLLVRIADAIRKEFSGDLATRMGVDTFVVATTREDTSERIERIHGLVDNLRRDTPLSLKAGICRVVNDRLDAPTVMDRAKIACDSIKGKYGTATRLFDSRLQHEVRMRDYLVKSLDDAIAKGYIRPYYQVIVRSFTAKACAVEVLSRWVDPNHGIISPGDFIPTLEQHHLIHKHDMHIVRCACHDLRSMMDAGHNVVPVSVNLSRLDFEMCDIFAQVEAYAQEFDIPRSLIGIEITESTLEQSNERFDVQLDSFRQAGYEIWMDDFGSGYSSLNVLKDYQFDVLKIDMAFLHGFDENHNSRKIIRSIIDMAKRIGIRTLAEGVENEAQFRFLRSIGCEMLQGYLFSRPVPFEDVELNEYAGIEDDAERGYLDVVGRVNLLSQQPVEAMRPTTAALSSETPFAIVEWDGMRFRYFTTNDAYLEHLRRWGFDGLGDAQRRLNKNVDLDTWLADVAASDASTNRPQTIRCSLGNDGYSMVVQYIARHGNSIALLLNPQSA